VFSGREGRLVHHAVIAPAVADHPAELAVERGAVNPAAKRSRSGVATGSTGTPSARSAATQVGRRVPNADPRRSSFRLRVAPVRSERWG
jgi:hypothetical protein